MQLSDSISNLIKERKSIRTFNGKNIDSEVLNKIQNFIDNLKGPFNERVRFKIINTAEETNGSKLGTYGVIKGTNYYIAAVVGRGEMDLEELGYEMESLILYVTSLGLGTCYIGGAFKGGQFDKVMESNEEEIFPIVVPIGYKGDNVRFIEKVLRIKSKSNTRKEWNELFYLRDLTLPITKFSTLGKYKEALENVRLAPSAINMQPWRIIKRDNLFHFYKYESVKNYHEKLSFDMQRVDMGIAMCHFELTCIESRILGGFIIEDPGIDELPQNYKYIASWYEYIALNRKTS